MYLCEHPLWILDSPFAITKENSLFFTEKKQLKHDDYQLQTNWFTTIKSTWDRNAGNDMTTSILNTLP